MGTDKNRQSQPPDRASEDISLKDIPLHSTNLLSLLDEEGVIWYQSPAIARLCGFEQAELVGVSCTDVFHPDDYDRVYDAFKNVVASEEFIIEAVEYRHLTADGSYVWVESVASSNPTPDGYYVINTRDISEKKAQQKELERANERLESFARIVSHDLRNPLAVAQGYLEIAESESPNDNHVTIETALNRMETLIESLLQSAFDETTDLDLEPVDLAGLVENCWANIVHDEATLILDIDDERPLRADVLGLTQLLENLLRNSIEHGSTDSRPQADESVEHGSTGNQVQPGDAIEHGRDTVSITVGHLEEGLYIEDDGPGIPEDARQDVFESGYSGESEGTGLGLAIVQGIVDAHGWSLRLTESTSGGARFEFTDIKFAAG